MTLDDQLLERAAQAAREQLLEELPQESAYVFSDLFEEKMHRLISAQTEPLKRSGSHWWRKAAVLVFAGFVGLSTCVLSVDAWRVKLFEMVERKYPEYSDIRYEPVAGSQSADMQRFQLVEYRPAYLPEGYRLTDQILHAGVNWSTYSDAQGNYLSFHQSVLGSVGSAINTEGAALEPFQLNGEDAFKMSNGGAQFVLWSDERYEYMVLAQESDVSLEEAVRIAGSVTVSSPGAYHPPHLEIPLGERPLDYQPEDALSNGDVTLVKGTLANEDVLDSFFAQVEKGVPAIICIADFDQEALLTRELYYDGFRIVCETDETRLNPEQGNTSTERNYQEISRVSEEGMAVVYLTKENGERDVLLRYTKP